MGIFCPTLDVRLFFPKCLDFHFVANTMTNTCIRWRALVLLPLLQLLACSSAPPLDVQSMLIEWSSHMQQNYQLRHGDRVAISVYQDSSLAQEVIVSPAGTISLRRIPEEIRVEGHSMGSVRMQIQRAYAQKLPEAEVSVSLIEVAAASLYVAGEVRDPGVIAYTKGMTASAAVMAAGGLKFTAKWNDVRILRNRPGRAPKTIRIDMDKTLHGEGPDLLLLPGDVLYAQTSAIADAGNWVELYIRRLLPFQFGTIPFRQGF
jgi:polysaccharide biosynthesis/export protein PslD